MLTARLIFPTYRIGRQMPHKIAPFVPSPNVWFLGLTQDPHHKRHLDRFIRFSTAHGCE